MKRIPVRALVFSGASVLAQVGHAVHAQAMAAISSPAFPAEVCAPHVACWIDLSVSKSAESTGNKFYTLAFVHTGVSTLQAAYQQVIRSTP